MAKAEDRSAVRSRRLITGALADLLQEKPLDKITVTDVVNRADINRGTFYAHYSDIPGVIDSLVDQSFRKIRQALDEQYHTPTELPGVIVRRVQSLLEEDMDFVRAVMTSSAAPLMQEQLCQVTLDYMLAQEPLFPNVSHERYVFNLRFCAGGLGNLYRDWFNGRIPLTLEQLTTQAEHILLQIMLQTNPDWQKQ